jgi:hypothetical protein
VTQLDLSGNLLVGLPLALAVLSNLIHLRKGGRRNAVFSELAKKKRFWAELKKNCLNEIPYVKIFIFMQQNSLVMLFIKGVQMQENNLL